MFEFDVLYLGSFLSYNAKTSICHISLIFISLIQRPVADNPVKFYQLPIVRKKTRMMGLLQ